MMFIPSRYRVSHRNGFTLLELLLVLALLVSLSAAVSPSLSRWQQEHELETAVSQFRRDLHAARMFAIHHATSVDVNLQNGSSFFSCRSTHPRSPDLLSSTPLPEGITIQLVPDREGLIRDNQVIRFFPEGTATAQTILIQDRRCATRLLEIQRATGQLQIRERVE
ncbi:MAG: prepilin-type N-terminal cleavage/methylation domain-containing protein [Planctomycetaceae bacterium]|nr:prepilin-type N-terminal cleavage/methylation domain-containing protein [Planctomycetaceae bacterium]